MKTVPASRAHDEWLHAQLKDPTFAAEFLATAATDDPAVYLLALRQVAEAHGMATIAKAAGIPVKACTARSGQMGIRGCRL
jgi:DNA-binding phage protein